MGSTLQPGLRRSANVEVSRDRTLASMREGALVNVGSTEHRLAGNAAKAGRS